MVNLNMTHYKDSGHGDGKSQICFDETAKYFVSCGGDGTAKIWKDFDNKPIKVIDCGENVYSIAVKERSLFVAPDNYKVEKYTFPDGDSDGVLSRFTGEVTHLSISESGKFIAAGSSDFDIKTHELDSKKQRSFLGHQAPILSVALDPLDKYLASTSCDGTMKIWRLQDEACVTTIPIIKSSNDVCNSATLARLAWRPTTGEDVAVPTSGGIKLFLRDTWAESQVLSTEEHAPSNIFQCCAFSPDGRFLTAAVSHTCAVVVWDVDTQQLLTSHKMASEAVICSIAWDPNDNNRTIFSDERGFIGYIEHTVPADKPSMAKEGMSEIDALFEVEDDHMMDLLDNEAKEGDDDLPNLDHSKKGKRKVVHDSDDDDGSRQSAGNFHSQDSDIPPIPSTLDVMSRELDVDLDVGPRLPAVGVDDIMTSSSPPADVGTGGGAGARFQQQPAFQPGATPDYLPHRFMIWNSVGVVRSYNEEVEDAIDVNFHNAQTHHSLHLANNDHYTLADLSARALVLACPVDDAGPSKLRCVHFSSWDNNKEWVIDMPEDEEIKVVTTAENWIAVATDALQVRLFTLGGLQKQIFSLPGDVLSMASHTDQLFIIYHLTQGADNNQCLAYMLIEVGDGPGCRPRNIASGQPLPITRRSTLTWLGFSAEGTPATCDSAGRVRMLNRAFCMSWCVVADTRKMVKGRHEHMWVVGVRENPQQLLYIMCKGSTYPSVLPKPSMAVHDFCMPMCEMERGEKGKYEEEYWRTRLFSSYGDYLRSRGYEDDEERDRKHQLQIQHTLMRLFALMVKTDQDAQAYDVCQLMPSTVAVNLAIKYASRVKKIHLAQKLGEIAQEKHEEEMSKLMKQQARRDDVMDNDDEDRDDDATEDVEDFRAGRISTKTEWGRTTPQPSPVPATSADVTTRDDSVMMSPSSQPLFSGDSHGSQTNTMHETPNSSQQSTPRINPFKKQASKSTPTAAAPKPETPSGGSVLSAIKRPNPFKPKPRPSAPPSGQKLRQGIKAASKTKQQQLYSHQTTLKTTSGKSMLTSTPKGKKGEKTIAQPEATIAQPEAAANDNNDVGARTMSGVQLYIEENLSTIQQEFPQLDGIEARKAAIKNFRALSNDEKQVWNDRGKCEGGHVTTEKRKRDDDDDENVDPTPRKKAIESHLQHAGVRQKLAAFAAPE